MKSQVLAALSFDRYTRYPVLMAAVNLSSAELRPILAELKQEGLVSTRLDNSWRRFRYLCQDCGETDPAKFSHPDARRNGSICNKCKRERHVAKKKARQSA